MFKLYRGFEPQDMSAGADVKGEIPFNRFFSLPNRKVTAFKSWLNSMMVEQFEDTHSYSCIITYCKKTSAHVTGLVTAQMSYRKVRFNRVGYSKCG